MKGNTIMTSTTESMTQQEYIDSLPLVRHGSHVAPFGLYPFLANNTNPTGAGAAILPIDPPGGTLARSGTFINAGWTTDERTRLLEGRRFEVITGPFEMVTTNVDEWRRMSPHVTRGTDPYQWRVQTTGSPRYPAVALDPDSTWSRLTEDECTRYGLHPDLRGVRRRFLTQSEIESAVTYVRYGGCFFEDRDVAVGTTKYYFAIPGDLTAAQWGVITEQMAARYPELRPFVGRRHITTRLGNAMDRLPTYGNRDLEPDVFYGSLDTIDGSPSVTVGERVLLLNRERGWPLSSAQVADWRLPLRLIGSTVSWSSVEAPVVTPSTDFSAQAKVFLESLPLVDVTWGTQSQPRVDGPFRYIETPGTTYPGTILRHIDEDYGNMGVGQVTEVVTVAEQREFLRGWRIFGDSRITPHVPPVPGLAEATAWYETLPLYNVAFYSHDDPNTTTGERLVNPFRVYEREAGQWIALRLTSEPHGNMGISQGRVVAEGAGHEEYATHLRGWYVGRDLCTPVEVAEEAKPEQASEEAAPEQTHRDWYLSLPLVRVADNALPTTLRGTDRFYRHAGASSLEGMQVVVMHRDIDDDDYTRFGRVQARHLTHGTYLRGWNVSPEDLTPADEPVAEPDVATGDDVSTPAALRAEIERLTAQHAADLAVISTVLHSEAEDRDWCDDYDRVIRSINERISTPIAPRTRTVNANIVVTGTFTYTVAAEVTVETGDPSTDDVRRAIEAQVSDGSVALARDAEASEISVNDWSLSAEDWD